MCEESSMKKKVPGHGRSRDEEPAGRAGPRRICQSRFQFPSQLRSQLGFPFLYPPSEVRIWRFGQILTSLERFRVVYRYVCSAFSIDFLYEKRWCCQYVAGGLRLDFLYTEHCGGAEIAILSTQRIPERRPCQKIAVLLTCT